MDPPRASQATPQVTSVVRFVADMNGFSAKVVSLEETEYLQLALGNHESEPTEYLIIQRDPNPTQQDIQLAQDTYYIEYSSQSNGAYGGLKQVQLSHNQLILLAESNSMLGFEKLEITVPEKLNEVAAMIMKLFQGSGVYEQEI